MSSELDKWWHALLDDARQLTVGDFEDADDPRQLLDRIPGFAVHRWLPRPGSDHCWYAVLRTVAGWIGVYYGTMRVDDEQYESWSSDWTLRLPLFIGALIDPLAGPSPDPEALAMQLASRPLPAEIDTGWHEGMLLILLLDSLEPEVQATHQVLLGLGYEQVVEAVAELANRVDNDGRLDEAQEALTAAFKEMHPEVGRRYTTPRDAMLLLAYRHDDWPRAALEVVTRLLEDERSTYSAALEFHRRQPRS